MSAAARCGHDHPRPGCPPTAVIFIHIQAPTGFPPFSALRDKLTVCATCSTPAPSVHPAVW
jgi:hypothetical protein